MNRASHRSIIPVNAGIQRQQSGTKTLDPGLYRDAAMMA
jgi:hypothetical protein